MTIIFIQLRYGQNNTEFLPHVNQGGALELLKINSKE